MVTLDPSKKERLEAILGDAVYGKTGVVSGGGIFRVTGLREEIVITANISDLKEAWQKPLRF